MKINPREIVVFSVTREISSKICQKVHENEEIGAKYVPFAKINTRET